MMLIDNTKKRGGIEPSENIKKREEWLRSGDQKNRNAQTAYKQKRMKVIFVLLGNKEQGCK